MMTRRLVNLVPLLLMLAVLGAALAAIAALHSHPDTAVEWRRLGHWLETTPPEVAFTAAAFHVLVAGTIWMLLSTGLYVIARLLDLPRLVAAAGLATLPLARRAVDRAMLVTAAAALLALPSAAAADQPSAITPPGTDSIGYTPQPAGFPIDDPLPEPPGDGTYVVQPGDNFWRIAAGEVSPGTDVAPYWRRLVDENRDTIRSGDPDLIYPGEQISMPPQGDPQ